MRLIFQRKESDSSLRRYLRHRIVHAADPLLTMQGINQNFPSVVSSLSRMKLNESIKDEIIENQQMIPPGKSLMALNGALINIEDIDLYFFATNRLITSKDHASVQMNVGHLNEHGVYDGKYTTFALCGFVRAHVNLCVFLEGGKHFIMLSFCCSLIHVSCVFYLTSTNIGM